MRKTIRKDLADLKEQLSEIYTSLQNNTIDVDRARAIIKLSQTMFYLTMEQIERDMFNLEKKQKRKKKKISKSLLQNR
jgi:MFS superfamily sulfate permease-like transporter